MRNVKALFLSLLLSAAVAAQAQVAPAPMKTPPRAASPAKPAARAMAAYLDRMTGQVQVQLDGVGPWAEGKGAMSLSPATNVRTMADSTVVIVFTDGSKVRLGPNAIFRLEAVSASKVSIYLGLGKIEAWIRKSARRSFQARIPVAVASVRGTIFGMNVPSESEGSVDLYSGNLAVTDNFGKTTNISDGQHLDITAGKGAAPPAPLPPNVTAPAEPPVTIPEVASAMAPTTPLGDAPPEEAPAEEVPAEPTTEVPTTSPIQETSTASPSAP